MKAVATTIADVQVLEPKVFEDSRGTFLKATTSALWRN